MMNEGGKSEMTTIRKAMSITKKDVAKWVLEKDAAECAHELQDMVHELSAAVQKATSSVLQKHPECAAFFGVRGRVELATSAQNRTVNILGHLGFGPGCNMEYVKELESWSKGKLEKCRKCRECSGEECECECESDDTSNSAPKLDKLMKSLKSLKTLVALREIMDDAVDEVFEEKKEEEEDEEEE